VLKPSEAAPLTVIGLVELLITVLPPDVLHDLRGLPTAIGYRTTPAQHFEAPPVTKS
jgi:hypothetical protein